VLHVTCDNRGFNLPTKKNNFVFRSD